MTDSKGKYRIVSNPFEHDNFIVNVILMAGFLLLVVIMGIKGILNYPSMVMVYLALGFLFAVGFVLVLVDVLKLKIIKVSDVHLVLEDWKGVESVIEREKIVAIDEINKRQTVKASTEKWKELFIYTEEGYVKILSNRYPNYKKLKDILIDDTPILQRKDRKFLNV